jgi:hypothetical protein
MKVIKPFFLGTLGGLALAAILLVGLYFSPLRETAYFAADPEMADVRAKLSQYRDWLAQADLYIVEKGPEASDSLRTAQTLAWREYKKWRTHLGDLARAHDRPTALGFLAWTYSLRYWAAPSAAILALFPALLLGWRSRSRFRPGRAPSRAKGARNKARDKVQNEAMNSFENAVKQIARISETNRLQAPDPEPEQAIEGGRVTGEEPGPDQGSGPGNPLKDPETKPFAILSDSGLETNFLQTGPVWGEPANSTLSGNAMLDTDDQAPSPAGLSMEDEDGDADEEATLGVMPPTTEVERVERRKSEVLKLARKGLTSSEISRRMRISQDQVEFIIRLRREKG